MELMIMGCHEHTCLGLIGLVVLVERLVLGEVQWVAVERERYQQFPTLYLSDAVQVVSI